MSHGDRDAAAEGTGDEPFLARWSRLKAQARHPEPGSAPESGERENDEEPAVPAAPAAVDAASPEGAPAPVQLPDLEQLHEDSDYSAFLTPGVDAELKKRALRKLFHSPKFNVFDGLDTYRDDFTSFPALGSIVTADMRYHLERAAREIEDERYHQSWLDAQHAPFNPPTS